MSLAALRTEIADCRAWERLLHAGSPTTRKAAALPGRVEFWFPLLMPLYGIYACATGTGFENEIWITLIPWWLLFTFGRLFPRAVPTEWEALRLPSRRGWLLARWSLRLPWLLHAGLCTLAHHFLIEFRDTCHFEGVRWPLLAAFLLAPLLFEAIAGWLPLQERAFGGQSWVAPMFALVLVLVLLGGATLGFLAKRELPGALLVSGLMAALAVVFLLLTLPSLATLRRGAAKYSGGTGTASMCRHGLISLAGVLPALVLATGVALPGWLLIQTGGPHLAMASWALLASTVLGLVAIVGNALRFVGNADLGVEPRPDVKVVERTGSARVSAVPASVLRGGAGLQAAAWALYRGKWRTLQHPWLTFVPKLLWECRAPVCGAIGALAFLGAAQIGGLRSFLALWMGGLFLFVLPRHLRLPPSRRLHFLGVDYGPLVVHNLRWGLLLEALPGVLGAAALLLVPLEVRGTAATWGALLAVAGVLILRQETGRSLVFALAWWAGRWALLALVAALVAGMFLNASWTLLVLGITLAALAAGTVLWDIRDPAGAGLRVEPVAADD